MLRVENACVYGPGAKVYLAEQVDAILAEKDMEIFNLKEELSYIKADSAFDRDKHEELLKSKDKEIESLKASHYAESVDAGMENRKLKRALWLARAERAKARKNYWYARCCHEGDDFLVSIDGSPVKYIGCIKRTNYDWLLTWSEVERKCLAKAEQYK